MTPGSSLAIYVIVTGRKTITSAKTFRAIYCSLSYTSFSKLKLFTKSERYHANNGDLKQGLRQ